MTLTCTIWINLACEQALVFGRASRERGARSRDTRFARPNRRACSQARRLELTFLWNIIPQNHITLRYVSKSVHGVEWQYLEHGHDARALSLLQANSRAEGGAFIRSLQTGFLGKKVDEPIKADYNRVEEGRGRKCSRYSHFYQMLRVRLPALRKRRRCWLENCGIKLLTVATALFDPQLRIPC